MGTLSPRISLYNRNPYRLKDGSCGCLSRPPHCMLIQNSVHLQFLKAQQADDQITTIKTLLETTPHDNYIVKNKLLYKTVNGIDLLVVPDEMQANIIKTAHERGHFAVLRTQDLVSKDFYIPMT
ncbi:transposon Ty3-I Gag-Pol polyprotein [Trichonephila clavipes]|nr:transposon Ty3-I Gag-Pol polyprotein [Trichonephila clavipes]